jgi:hypothetical protein
MKMNITSSNIVRLSNWCSVALGLVIGLVFLDPMTLQTMKGDIGKACYVAYKSHTTFLTQKSSLQIMVPTTTVKFDEIVLTSR